MATKDSLEVLIARWKAIRDFARFRAEDRVRACAEQGDVGCPPTNFGSMKNNRMPATRRMKGNKRRANLCLVAELFFPLQALVGKDNEESD